jgi:hypothetical protein
MGGSGAGEDGFVWNFRAAQWALGESVRIGKGMLSQLKATPWEGKSFG